MTTTKRIEFPNLYSAEIRLIKPITVSDFEKAKRITVYRTFSTAPRLLPKVSGKPQYRVLGMYIDGYKIDKDNKRGLTAQIYGEFDKNTNKFRVETTRFSYTDDLFNKYETVNQINNDIKDAKTNVGIFGVRTNKVTIIK